MQEIFEKIIERLEELRKAELDIVDDIDENGFYNDCEEAFEDGERCGRYSAYATMLNFVKEVAEEFGSDINVRSNDGWIPCSDSEIPNKSLDSLHEKILKSKFSEEVTEEEIYALVKAKLQQTYKPKGELNE